MAAENFGRQWIGIDISPPACCVMAKRGELKVSGTFFGLKRLKDKLTAFGGNDKVVMTNVDIE